MDFQTGDWVVHCTQGLGQVQAVEERTFGQNSALYYQIQIADLSIWVPDDENLNKRLRKPVKETDFKNLFTILSSSPEALPVDRRIRNQYLADLLKEGSLEAVCRVIRDLTAHRKNRTWNEYDGELMRRVKKAFISEWSFIFAIDPHDAENELQKLLTQSIA
jgi:RNA polymerase-interacting CarD/CdnL/TRCF family regulator